MFQEVSLLNYKCEDCGVLLYGSPDDTYFKEHTSVCNHGVRSETGRNETHITYFKNYPAVLQLMDYSKVSHSGSEIKIYMYLLESDKTHKNSEFHTNELLDKLNIPKATLTRSLKSMVKKGVLVRIAHGKYLLPEPSQELTDFINKIPGWRKP
jgi:hypothetical protein